MIRLVEPCPKPQLVDWGYADARRAQGIMTDEQVAIWTDAAPELPRADGMPEPE